MKILVAGAGGFIGGHLVKDLARKGHYVLAADIKPLNEWWRCYREAQNWRFDLSNSEDCKSAIYKMDRVINAACNMGGMGFIENNKALCMLSVLINTNLLNSVRANLERYFFCSSACVYNADKQKLADLSPLKEEDAYPAMPEDGYGWEKLFSERMCRHYREDFNIPTRIARLHNVYGPYGSWQGGREKAPAAICRKIAMAKITSKHEIEIWGDGTRTRSFQYIDDCIHGINLINDGDYVDPINLGTSELVSINDLVSIVEEIAGIQVKRNYNLDRPQGVMGRNSDNTLIKKVFGWEPSIPLKVGLEKTYKWIYNEIQKVGADNVKQD
tara:strand:+ start:4289 stop:5272 length:984 start_codon:yes stop_codon:yes gene_type:complete